MKRPILILLLFLLLSCQGGTVVADYEMFIEFNSEELTRRVMDIIENYNNPIQYALKAHGGNYWDIKSKLPNHGSILFGKYASSRDAGNFAADPSRD